LWQALEERWHDKALSGVWGTQQPLRSIRDRWHPAYFQFDVPTTGESMTEAQEQVTTKPFTRCQRCLRQFKHPKTVPYGPKCAKKIQKRLDEVKEAA